MPFFFHPASSKSLQALRASCIYVFCHRPTATLFFQLLPISDLTLAPEVPGRADGRAGEYSAWQSGQRGLSPFPLPPALRLPVSTCPSLDCTMTMPLAFPEGLDGDRHLLTLSLNQHPLFTRQSPSGSSALVELLAAENADMRAQLAVA